MMRITGGEFRGRKIKTLEGMDTRPILTRVRKSLFDIIGPGIAGSDFLDLFAGTGSVGIEALSRGAGSATFVENAGKAVQVIRDNLRLLGIAEKSRVCGNDVLSWLNIASESGEKYGIIFIGPPYFKSLADKTLASLSKMDLLESGGNIFV